MRRYELTDKEWSIIQPLLPNELAPVSTGHSGIAMEA